MAQVPNFYFNSPYIETAARSLASALAPPDPQELLQRERAKFMFGREQLNATRADEKYADQQAAEEAFAKMVSPVYDPATGALDQAATSKQVMEQLSIALQNSGDPATALRLAGTNSPEMAVKEAVANFQANKLLAGIAARGDIQRGLQDSEHDWKDDNREDTQTFTAEQNKLKREHEANQNYLKQQARLRGEAAKRKAGGGSWHSPPDNIVKEITYGLEDLIALTGRTMSYDQRSQFVDRAITRWQTSGNPVNAVNAQWAASFPNATGFEDVDHDPDVAANFWGFGGSRGGLKPSFVDDPMADLGDVATNTEIAPLSSAPPPSPAPAPKSKPPSRTPPRAGKGPRGTPPEGARGVAKDGKPTIYRNGRWEYAD